MLRFLKYLRVVDWFALAGLLAFLVVQITCDVTLPTYTAEIVSKMQMGASAASILETGKVMLGFAAVSVGATVVQTFLSAAVSTRLGTRIRGKVFAKAITFSGEESGRFTAGTLLTRTTNDVQQVVSALILGLRLGIGAPLMAIMAILRIAQSTWELTLSTAIGVVILLVGILTILMIVTPRFKRIQKLTDQLNGVTRESLTGLRVVRAHGADAYQQEKFEAVNQDFMKQNMFTGRMMSALNPLIMLVNYGIMLAIYWIGCALIVSNNDPNFFPTMFSFTQLAGQVVMAFMVLLMLFMMLPRAQVSARRIHEVLSLVPAVQDPIESAAFSARGTVEFDQVAFGYVGAEECVLSGLTFRVERGETLAIIGATGAGKSTLLKLVSRFFDATKGTVRINGIDVRSVRQKDLHAKIGYVPQKSLLFSGTVFDNIGFGNASITEAEAVAAAKAACADGFIAQKGGLGAVVTQGGKNFSGGQRQRLSIARALAVKPDIYLFDDCFSALDYATDQQVRANLKTYAPEATKIIVAQRVGTIMDADKIMVLDKGEVVGMGSHRELLLSCDAYQKIARSQLSEEELAI